MTTLKNSGHLATAQTVAWTGATQKIDSLTDNEYTDLSDEIDNSSNKYAFAELRLVLGSAAFTGADSSIEIFLVPIGTDGSTYPSWTGNTTTDQSQNEPFRVTVVPMVAATQAQDAMTGSQERIALPQNKYKFALRSRANVTLAGSGNTLYWRPYSFDMV